MLSFCVCVYFNMLWKNIDDDAVPSYAGEDTKERQQQEEEQQDCTACDAGSSMQMQEKT